MWLPRAVVAWVILATVESRQINPVSVLLPYTVGEYNRVNVTLQAYGGCYRWRVQRPNVVKIRDPVGFELEEGIDRAAEDIYADSGEEVGTDSECHNMVVVSQWFDKSLKRSAIDTREKSWVFAEDIMKGGDGGVKCEVYVARIEKIVIETTAKSLAVGGVETLTIRGFDSEGNVFTSLEGLRFQWEIENPNIIAIASLKNDVYRPTPIRRMIHEQGEESDIILLKGLVSGRTLVSARLTEDGYQDIPPTQVWLDVIEPIVVVPNHLIVPPLSEVNLGVKVLRDKETPSQAKLVTQPHPNFSWTSSSEIASVNPFRGDVVIEPDSPVPATATVQVSDRRNLNNTDFTTIYVRHPYSLRLMQSPLRLETYDEGSPLITAMEELYQRQFNPEAASGAGAARLLKPNSMAWKRPIWYITKDQPILIGSDVLTADHESFYIPRNAEFRINATEGLDILWTSESQALAVGVPRTLTSGNINAQFVGVNSIQKDESYQPTSEITVNQKFVVVDPIELEDFPPMHWLVNKYAIGSTPQSLPLSDQPIVLPLFYEAEFNVRGGSGNYKVESSDSAICRIASKSNQSHIAVKTSGHDGIAVLTIMDEMNSENFYRVPCVAANIKNILYDAEFQQIPVSNRETIIPVRAKPIISAPITESPFWKPGSVEFFTQCNKKSVHTTTRGDAVIRVLPPSKIYECSRLEVLTNYDQPQILELAASIKPDITTATQLEFYAPLEIKLPRPNAIKNVQGNNTISSARIANSVAIAVDSTLVIQLMGGPSIKAGCTRTLDVDQKGDTEIPGRGKANAKVAIHRIGADSEGSGEFLQNFQVSCLDKITLYEVDFNMRTSCTDNSQSTLTAKIIIGCSVPYKVQIIPVDSKNVEYLPAENREWPFLKGSHPNVKAAPEIVASNKIYFTVNEHHAFQPVAWDSFGREILNISSFHPKWWLSSNDPIESDSSGDRITIKTNKDTFRGKLSLALMAESRRGVIDANNNNWLPTDNSKSKYLAASLQIAASEHPSFRWVPENNEPLVHLPNWAYRILTVDGSGRNDYTISPPTKAHILAVEHGVGIPPAVRDYKPHWTVIDLSKSSRSNELTRYDDALVQSLELGNTTLTVEDKSLLGARPISIQLSFNAVTSLDLGIYDHLPDGKKVLKAHSTKSGSLREIQTHLDYEIEFTARTDHREFNRKLANALATGVTANPPARLTKTPKETFTLSVANPGRYFITGYLLDTDGVNKTVRTDSVELLAHLPLTVEPRELVLLPDGSTWEIDIRGGSSGMGSYGIVSADKSVVAVAGDINTNTKSVIPRIVTGHKGKTTLTVVRSAHQDDDERTPVINVEVAQPAQSGVVINGKLFTSSAPSQLVGIPNKKTGRIVGQLLTAQGKPFTLGLLGLPDDNELPQPGYKCEFTWTSDSPRVLAFVNDEIRKNDSGDDYLVGKLSGRGRIAATFSTLSPGNARVTFSSECAANSGWTNKFSRFTDSITVAVMVTEDTSAISEIENGVTGKGIYTDLKPTLVADINPHAHTFGEPLRVLRNSKYTFTMPWGVTKSNIMCKDATANPTACISLETDAPLKELAVKNDDQRIDLVTGAIVGHQISIVLQGQTSQQILYIPLIISDPQELQILPDTPANKAIEPNALVARPILTQPFTMIYLRTILRDADKRLILIPDDLDIELVVSHPSRLEVTKPAQGRFIATALDHGSATISARIPDSYNRLIQDSISILVPRPEPATSEEAIIKAKIEESTSWYEMWMSSIGLVPWLTTIDFRGPWNVFFTAAAACLLGMWLVSRRNSPQVLVSRGNAKSRDSSPNWKSGVGLARDWTTAGTPANNRVQMSAFPSGKRTYAPDTSTFDGRG